MRQWLQIGTALVSTAVVLNSATVEAATALQAFADNRAGTIVADTTGSEDPIEAGYNVNPGENDFDPITFNQQVQVDCSGGFARATLNTSSNWVGYNGAGGTFQRFTLNSTATGRTRWNPSPCNGFANADDNILIGFTPVTVGGTADFPVLRLRGSVDASGTGSAIIRLKRNGATIFTAESGAFDRVFPATLNAEYQLEAISDIATSAFGASDVQGAATMTAELELIALRTGAHFTNPDNGHVYYITNNYTWSTADLFAKSFGGYLASINDADENAWVQGVFSALALPDANLWLGLNDAAVEGQFVWTSGEPVTYLNWAAGEPNNQSNEDYAQMLIVSGVGGRWNDVPNTGGAGLDYAIIEVPVGDVNCDGTVTVSDISPFVLALTDPDEYRAQFPDCNEGRADMNRDLQISVSDIGPFVNLLVGM